MTGDTDSANPAPKIDSTVPHSARIWNYWLGGKDNYPVDRAAGDQFLAVYPEQRDKARAVRAFLTRVVRYLTAEAGVRQFLDVGTGLPTMDNTHQIAQRIAPESKIVYVDNDPLVLVHARALLTSSPEGVTNYIDADMHEPDAILAEATKTLDFDKPIALIMMGVLGHVGDYTEARSIVRRLTDALPSGSYFSQCDGTATNAAYIEAIRQYARGGGVPYNLRSPEEIAGFYDGLELVEPGVGPITRWRPVVIDIGEIAEVDQDGGIGRKP